MVVRGTSIGADNWEFPKTAWSSILEAKDRNSKDYKEQLGYLVYMYWKPVYRYIRYMWKKTHEDAKDLTQEFFARFIEKDYLESVSPEKGRFRSYVKAALKHFLMNVKDKETAQKRGGGTGYVSFDERAVETGEGKDDPVGLFDKEWAKTVIERCVKNLEKKLKREGKEIYFRVFERYFLQKDASEQLTREDIARELGLKLTDVKNYLVYSKQLLKRIMISEVGRYVANPMDTDDEVKFLLSIEL